MTNVFDEALKSLEQVIEYERGDKTKARSRVVEIKDLHVKPLKQYSKEELKSIRLKNNLTLKTFADCFGVSQKTVESWERGENAPSGASVRLFQLLEQNPHTLDEYILVKEKQGVPV